LKDQSITGIVGGVVIASGHTVIKKKEKLSLLSQRKTLSEAFFINDMVKVYPNPVSSGSSIHIDFVVKNTGEFDINIINTSGQSFFHRKIILDSKKYTEQINCPCPNEAGNLFCRRCQCCQ